MNLRRLVVMWNRKPVGGSSAKLVRGICGKRSAGKGRYSFKVYVVIYMVTSGRMSCVCRAEYDTRVGLAVGVWSLRKSRGVRVLSVKKKTVAL